VVFGEKAISILSAANDVHFSVTNSLEGLDDNVLDCRLLQSIAGSENAALTLIIGYAHNFVDLMELEGTEQQTLLQRFYCPEVSALFSMSISVDASNDILIGSGTVFGKIIIWRPESSEHDVQSMNKGLTGTILVTAHDHEGVIFRISWSRDRQQLISVADDRTVRLWSLSLSLLGSKGSTPTMTPRYTGWGHISRLWDAVFLDRGDAKEGSMEVATCSEDGTIKLWNTQGCCVATLQGTISWLYTLYTICYTPSHS
jgi:WD40 repeat protein